MRPRLQLTGPNNNNNDDVFMLLSIFVFISLNLYSNISIGQDQTIEQRLRCFLVEKNSFVFFHKILQDFYIFTFLKDFFKISWRFLQDFFNILRATRGKNIRKILNIINRILISISSIWIFLPFRGLKY